MDCKGQVVRLRFSHCGKCIRREISYVVVPRDTKDTPWLLYKIV